MDGNDILFTGGGNIGVGLTDPDQKLEVDGNIKLSSSTPRIYLGDDNKQFFG